MKYVVDTNALSQLLHSDGDQRVKQVARDIGASNLYVSTITLGEIHKGVLLLPRGRKRDYL